MHNEMYVLRIVSIEMVFLAYIVFYVFTSFVARNTIIALVMSWIGFAIGGLVVFFDNKIILPRVKKISALIGPNTVKYIMLDDFTAAQGLTTIGISLCFIVAFVIIGIHNLS